MSSAVGGRDIGHRVIDALDLGVLVVDDELRILVMNAAARALLSTSRERIEDDRLCALLRGHDRPASGDILPATLWTNADGRTAFVRSKRLEPHGLLVTLGRERVRGRDLVEVLHDQFGLTVRQQQIVLLLRDGLSNRAIAQQLSVSEGTVKTYLTAIFQAFEVGSRTALLAAIERLRPVR